MRLSARPNREKDLIGPATFPDKTSGPHWSSSVSFRSCAGGRHIKKAPITRFVFHLFAPIFMAKLPLPSFCHSFFNFAATSPCRILGFNFQKRSFSTVSHSSAIAYGLKRFFIIPPSYDVGCLMGSAIIEAKNEKYENNRPHRKTHN